MVVEDIKQFFFVVCLFVCFYVIVLNVILIV